MRVSGLANLRDDPEEDAQNDVFLTQRRLRIRLKGGDETWVPIGKKAAAAVDRYIRVRARHAHASSPWLWLGSTGRGVGHMTDSGIRAMVKRRAPGRDTERPPAPLPPILRRPVASSHQAAPTDDLMHITGWKTYDMVREYTEARGVARAHQAHARLSQGSGIVA